MSESDGSTISGGMDALAEDIITVADAPVAVKTSIINFNRNMVAVDQALKQAKDMVERPWVGDSSLATVSSPTTETNLYDLQIINGIFLVIQSQVWIRGRPSQLDLHFWTM